MLVVACRNSDYYLDMQGYPGAYITKYVNHTPLFIALLLFATLASSVAYLLIADRLAVAGVKGQLTIPQKVAKALRDYKGEMARSAQRRQEHTDSIGCLPFGRSIHMAARLGSRLTGKVDNRIHKQVSGG